MVRCSKSQHVVLQLLADGGAVTAAGALPQLTTEPSRFRAAKAVSLAVRLTTSVAICSLTALLFPPVSGWPQLMTEPSLPRAAKA